MRNAGQLPYTQQLLSVLWPSPVVVGCLAAAYWLLVVSCWLLVVGCCAETQLSKYLSFVRHLPAMIMCFMFALRQRHGKLFTGIESARPSLGGCWVLGAGRLGGQLICHDCLRIGIIVS